MYRHAYQRGMLTIFYSVGSKPLKNWDTHTQSGYISRFLDQDIKSMVLEIGGTNVSTTYMICPKGNLVLGITMPFLIIIAKNLKKYFSFEVTILDETSTRRRFRVSNFQSTTQILPLCTVMPLCLSDGWNQIQFNLGEFTRRAYKKQYVEVQKVKINANIRLRRIYFAEKIMPEDQLPQEYKLFFPLQSKRDEDKKAAKTTTEKEILDVEIKVSKTGKSPRMSMYSLKKPSQEQNDYGRPSRIIAVPEAGLERMDAATNVPVLTELSKRTSASADTSQVLPPIRVEERIEGVEINAKDISEETRPKVPSATLVEGEAKTENEELGGYEKDVEDIKVADNEPAQVEEPESVTNNVEALEGAHDKPAQVEKPEPVTANVENTDVADDKTAQVEEPEPVADNVEGIKGANDEPVKVEESELVATNVEDKEGAHNEPAQVEEPKAVEA